MLERIDIESLTPMMKQYATIKKQYKDAILFFRLGDFYEMFFDDAITASKELEIALTKRDCGLEEKAPMCGVPYHAVEPYITRLVSKGYKVALCDQVEDPQKAVGIVQREVTRIISPGTLTDTEALNLSMPNNLVCIILDSYGFALASMDVMTGHTAVFEIHGRWDENRDVLIDEMIRFHPSEIIIIRSTDAHNHINWLKKHFSIPFTMIDLPVKSSEERILAIKDMLGKVQGIKALSKRDLSLIAFHGLLTYAFRFQSDQVKHVRNIDIIEPSHYMSIDANTIRNLELFTNTAKNQHTLIHILDQTKTAMGARMLREWVSHPLISAKAISNRQQHVDALMNNAIFLDDLRQSLDHIYDIERLTGKISYGRANGRDLIALKNSIQFFPTIIETLKQFNNHALNSIIDNLDDLSDIYHLVDRAIVDEPPITITEGELIKEGYHDTLDALRHASVEGSHELVEYEDNLRESTGIKNLKIIFNKKTGYFIDVTKSNFSKVPDEFELKQTLTNSSRFTTPTLNSIQRKIQTSGQETIDMEYELFQEVRSVLLDQAVRIQKQASEIAYIDCVSNFAYTAIERDYCRPSYTNRTTIEITEGRHPVVELSLGDSQFIANDFSIGEKTNRLQIITGPNMGGKSTFMRQNALIVLMGQIGSYVPAKIASLCIVDKLFSRLGASDNLALGESTFMVEMKEMSDILRNATANSFIVLDEVGRGTSTNDGLSIAQAIVEYLSTKCNAKTLFATHYHEMTNMEDHYKNTKNYKVAIAEENNDIVFLRKVIPGKADKSYGLEVAKLAGLPTEIIDRAYRILFDLNVKEQEDRGSSGDMVVQNDFADFRLRLFLNHLQQISIDSLSPLEAMNILNDLIQQAKELDYED